MAEHQLPSTAHPQATFSAEQRRMLFERSKLSLIDYGESAIVIELIADNSLPLPTTLLIQSAFWQLDRIIKRRMAPHLERPNLEACSMQDLEEAPARNQLSEVVLGNQNITVVFDPLRTDKETVVCELDNIWSLVQANAISELMQPDIAQTITHHKIDAVFNVETGPDLAQLAAETHNSIDSLIKKFCEAEYRVLFTGFLPGFAYMAGLAPELYSSRLAIPRQKVPAGSLAIGGEQVGIYPQASPGGWKIIGRIAQRHMPIYSDLRTRPSLLAAADHVRFKAIEDCGK